MNTLPKTYDENAMIDFLGIRRPIITSFEDRMTWVNWQMAATKGQIYSAMARHLLLVDAELEEAVKWQNAANEQYALTRNFLDRILEK